MNDKPTLGQVLQAQGVSRRGFMKYCAATASLLALPPTMVPRIAQALEQARRPSVIWLSFQECTGCTESLTRSSSPTLEGLIFDTISLDYHHTLQAASGDAAEAARHAAMEENAGQYLVLVDGSIPLGNPGYSTIAGMSNVDMLRMKRSRGAAAVVAIGSCAAFGGIPGANPEPDGRRLGHGPRQGQTGHQRSRLSADPDGHHGRAGAVPDLRAATRSRSARSPDGVFRTDDPRPLLSPAVLRTG